MARSAQSAPRQGRRLTLAAAAVLVLAGILAATRWSRARPTLPTAVVRLGQFTDYLELRGHLEALRSVSVNAPANAGDDLQILRLAREGAQVKKGGVLVRFDTSKLEESLAEDRSALRAAQAGIKQSQAQERIALEQDTTDALKARYGVDSAKLDASKQEIVSKIEGAEARLAVQDAESKQSQAEGKLHADSAGGNADVEGQKDKYAEALYNVQQDQRRIGLMTLKAPIDGVVTLLPNYRAGGFFSGGSAPPFREGDRPWSGAAILEIPDLSTLRLSLRVEETDRARVAVGEPATVRVDAVPDRSFAGHVARISTLASIDFSAGWPFPKNFELQVGLDQTDPRLRPGMNASARIAVERLANAILIPPAAAFQKSGRTVAYVLRGSTFEERVIEVSKTGETELAVASGLRPGERVALQDPMRNRS